MGDARPLKRFAWSVTCDLADGKSQASIARKYGVSQQSISEFAKKNAEEIESLRDRVRQISDGLWIADKTARIEAYQETARAVDELLAAERESSVPSDRPGEGAELETQSHGGALKRRTGGVPLAELLRTQQAAYRAVAEELGDLPQRIKIEGGGEPVKHVIEGVDLGDLT